MINITAKKSQDNKTCQLMIGGKPFATLRKKDGSDIDPKTDFQSMLDAWISHEGMRRMTTYIRRNEEDYGTPD